MSASLYRTDYHAWTQDQAARLRQAAVERINTDLDWDNLAEEIEGMGGSERREIHSRLIELLFHIAKLAWSPDTAPRADWTVSVLNQRDGIAFVIKDSPSLTRYPGEVFEVCWSKARKRTAVALALPLSRVP
ncbi:MAG: DUF29 domain-containing protein, partial [Rhodospirillaceae bacterium]